MILGFTLALFETYSYKSRQQKLLFDSEIFTKFLIFLCSNVANALFAVATILTLHIFCLQKSQTTVKILPPIKEQDMIEIFFISAFILKVASLYAPLRISLKLFPCFQSIKLIQHLWSQINCDVFFIDWERPRIFEQQITLRPLTSNLDTPSISSGGRSFQQNDGISAWRTYFVANEWIKLSTIRKCSMYGQIITVSIVVIVSVQCS